MTVGWSEETPQMVKYELREPKEEAKKDVL